ncbi:MAG: hypothetical protein A2W68_03375 [Betaproteobacteria bacterium RIFCSPLOWO2_02_64_14]|nr:MAG: hypothetical protein A2W68_03375 [Betaproteobacteria bacterium RIFCSPLOWO2_02_64_14]
MSDAAKFSQFRQVSDDDAALAAWLATVPARMPPSEAEMVAKAIGLAAPTYANRSLASGEPVLAHVLAVADMLLQLKLDHETVAAALVFRSLELAPDLAAQCRERLGSAVTGLAEGVLRMAQIGALSSRRQGGQRPAEQVAQLEALRNRLGVWQLKWELEDLSLRILEPDAYKKVAGLLDEKRADRERYIEGVIAVLRQELGRAGIVAEVTGRPKHIFSIYKKMQLKNVDFELLYDVRAVRILVASVKDCYAALGLVHHLWSPIPKGFDDYIARPKSNGYRSLHTAVVGPEAKAIEVQIRTHEMHQNSELGVAAHWRYKEGSRPEGSYDQKIAWLRQILEWKDEVRDTNELAEQFRTGLAEDTVYVLTPQGRVIDLPKGATPIDFAYHVHSELGHRCRGAKLDGAMAPLNTPLRNGQRVEILAAKQGGPSRDWLNPQLGYLKSQGARTKVRQWFNRQNYEAEVTQGRALLDRELQRHGKTALNLDQLAGVFGHAKTGDFLAEVGRGEIGPKQLHDALASPDAAPPSTPAADTLVARKSRSGGQGSVLVVGVDKLLTTPAKCCKPAPPEPIIGFVTRGRGVSVHRAGCVNVKRLDPERMVTAEWGAAAGATFAVDIEIDAIDRTGLLRDISEVLSRERINVTATKSLSTDLAARMRFTVEVADLDQLRRALGLIREVRGVVRATRR